MQAKKLEEYTALLAIRAEGQQRAVLVTGAAFLLSAVGSVGYGLLGGLSGRSLYLVVPIVAVFGMSYLMAWARLEITKQSMELLGNLKRAAVEPAE